MAHYITWEDDAGTLQWLSFDRLDVEEHEAPTEVTEYPVEEGSDINDNARPGVKRVRLEGYISNKPLLRNLFTSLQTDKADFLPMPLQFKDTVLAGNRAQAFQPPLRDHPLLIGPGALIEAINIARENTGPIFAQLVNYLKTPSIVTARVLQQPVPVDRVEETQTKLNDIWTNSRLLYVVTSLETYTDMAIERRTSSKRKSDGSGASFVLELKKVVFANSSLVAAPNTTFKVPMGSRASAAVKLSNAQMTAKLKELAASRPDAFGDLVNRVPD